MPAYKITFLVTGVFPLHLSLTNFLILCSSTLYIAMGGYIINDYFDTVPDEINKPGKNVIGKLISANTALYASCFLFALGILAGFYIALKIQKPMMGCVQVFCAASLYMYSTYYQKRILSGNFLIAVLSALSILIIGLYEPDFYPNFAYLLWYASFAFTTTLLRELLKDMEDFDGDEKAQYKTFPIWFGLKATKSLALFYVAVNLIVLFYILFTNFYDNVVINFWYLYALFAIPFLALAYLISQAEVKKDFMYASLFTKLIMFAGICSMFGFWFYFLK